MEKIVSLKDIEEIAKVNLSKPAYDYYFSGADGMSSLIECEQVYNKIKLRPSLFSNPEKFKGLETKIFGKTVNSPIFVASTAFHKMAHPDGEIATARACEQQNNTAFMLSSWSTTPLEKVAESAPNTMKMFQIYLSKKEDVR